MKRPALCESFSVPPRCCRIRGRLLVQLCWSHRRVPGRPDQHRALLPRTLAQLGCPTVPPVPPCPAMLSCCACIAASPGTARQLSFGRCGFAQTLARRGTAAWKRPAMALVAPAAPSPARRPRPAAVTPHRWLPPPAGARGWSPPPRGPAGRMGPLRLDLRPGGSSVRRAFIAGMCVQSKAPNYKGLSAL